MTIDLRNDLLIIVLEEAFGMRESYARHLVVDGGIEGRFRRLDNEALDAAKNVVARIDARCSKIVG
jgi:hypothetical protein